MVLGIKRFDEKLVSITDTDGSVYEGFCSYNSAEYNEHEFGVSKDGLQMQYILFYRRDIRSVKRIKEFSEEYGKLEFEAMIDGYGLTEELLSSEDDIHVIRILKCLCDFSDKVKDERIDDKVKSLLKYGSDEVKAEAERFLEKKRI